MARTLAARQHNRDSRAASEDLKGKVRVRDRVLRADSRFVGDTAFGMTRVFQNSVADHHGFCRLLLPASDGFSGFLVCGAAAFGFAFVPELLAFG